MASADIKVSFSDEDRELLQDILDELKRIYPEKNQVSFGDVLVNKPERLIESDPTA